MEFSEHFWKIFGTNTPETDPLPTQILKRKTPRNMVIVTLVTMVITLGGGIAFFMIGQTGKISKCVIVVRS